MEDNRFSKDQLENLHLDEIKEIARARNIKASQHKYKLIEQILKSYSSPLSKNKNKGTKEKN